MPGSLNPLIRTGAGEIEGCNFIARFFEECESIGTHPKNAKWCRFQHSQKTIHNSTHEEIKDNVNKLQDIVGTINNEGRPCTHETIRAKVCALKDLGGVSWNSFCSIGVHTGMLHSERARLQSLRSTICPIAPFGKELMKCGCPRAEFDSVLKRLACMRKEDECVTENVGCKACRSLHSWDVFWEDQFLCNRVKVKVDGKDMVKLFRRKHCEGDWMECDPKILRPND